MATNAVSERRRSPLLVLGALIFGVLVVGAGGVALWCGSGDRCAAAAAQLSAEEADVFHLAGESARQQVQSGVSIDVRKGDGIDVNDLGRALLFFPNGLLVKIFRESDVKLNIEGSIDPHAAPAASYWLHAGSVFNTTTAQAEAEKRVVVRTNNAIITDLGTEFFVHYDQERQATWVVVREGQVRVTAPEVPGPNNEVILGAGQQTWVFGGRPPQPPVPATRTAVGNLFPPIEVLTNNNMRDDDLLRDVVAAAATPTPTVSPSPTPTVSPSPTPTPTASPSPVVLRAVALRATSVPGGDPDTSTVGGAVTLRDPAPSGGVNITLTSSNPAAATVPSSVPVAAGQTSANFSVTTLRVPQTTDVEITATYRNSTATTSLTVLALPVVLDSLTLTPPTVITGGTGEGTVTLSGPAPANGVLVTLASSDPDVAEVGPSVTVDAGATGARFPITVNGSGTADISAAYNDQALTQTLTVTEPPIALASLELVPTTVEGASESCSVVGIVSLSSPAPRGGVEITLTSSDPDLVSVPETLVMEAGDTRSSFDLCTPPVTETTQIVITATYGEVQRTSTLTVLAPIPTATPVPTPTPVPTVTPTPFIIG